MKNAYRVQIIEVDRDYRTVVSTEYLDFSAAAMADLYCAEQSWTGSVFYAEHSGGRWISEPEQDAAA